MLHKILRFAQDDTQDLYIQNAPEDCPPALFLFGVYGSLRSNDAIGCRVVVRL